MKQIIILSLLLLIFAACTPGNSDKTDVQVERHLINLSVNPAEKSAIIEDKITFTIDHPETEIRFLINENARIEDVKLFDKIIEFQLNPDFDLGRYVDQPDSESMEDYKGASELQLLFSEPVESGELNLKYTLQATDSVNKAAFSREYIAYQVKGYIGDKGVFISPGYFWYAGIPNSLTKFHLTFTSPDSFQLLSQGKMIRNDVEDSQRTTEWEVDYPVDGIHVIGSKYQVSNLSYKDVDIYTFFFPETQGLSESYLTASQRYLGMYEKMIGPYPFSKFAVIENFFPTGYGMPSYTLLGSQVIRLPFIIYTSLGHEIAHNWWGNSVYIDYDSGNWCEGLTTYYADYHYKEMKSPADAMQYRRDLDRDFTVYVKESKDIPLKDFTERTESASRAVGYGKSAMVFHQLRKIIGDSLFYESLRQFYRNNKFRRASWNDIKTACENTSGDDLGWYFNQWIERNGAPKLTLEDADYSDGKVIFELSQTEPAFRLYVPVEIQGEDLDTTRYVWFEKPSQTFEFDLAEKPERLAIDPNFDVFRKLDREEIPPTLSEIFASDTVVIVLPDKTSEQREAVYKRLAESLAEGKENFVIKAISNLSEREKNNQTLVFLGAPTENSLIVNFKFGSVQEVKLQGDNFIVNENPSPAPNDVTVLTFRDANRSDRSFSVIAVGSNGKIGRVGSLLSHYGKYSYLVFSEGRNQQKDVYSVNRSPLVHEF